MGALLRRAHLCPSHSVTCQIALLCSLVIPLLSAAQSVRMAEKFPGSDAGQKINACIAALPPTGGVCDARNLSGDQQSSSSITVGTESKPVELLLGATTLVVSKPVILQAKSSIVGLPTGSGIGTYQGATVIRAGDQTQLPGVLQVMGRLGVVQDLTIDGNKTKNGGEGSGIVVSAWRAELFRVTVQNSPGHGIAIVSANSNEACCPKLEKVISIYSGKAGLFIERTGDPFVLMSEFENNGTNGVELSSSSGMRIQNSDFGGNKQSGLLLYGTAALPTAYSIIVGNQFGNNAGPDLSVAGSDGTHYGSLGHLISSNGFLAGGVRENGKHDAVQIVDSAYNVITANSFFAVPGHAYRACVSVTGRREKLDQISNNFCHRADSHSGEEYLGVGDTVFSGNQGRTRNVN